MKHHLLTIILNFSAAALLLTLIATPIYFAKNFAQVAGVKSESAYLIISQIEKFPKMTLNQSANTYTITFTKQAPSQAYLSVIIVNNPTTTTKTYKIRNQSTYNRFFFGEDLKNQQTKIDVPPQTSAPISLLSTSNIDTQPATFQIQVN